MSLTEAIHKISTQILTSGKATLIIGFTQENASSPYPTFVRSVKDIRKLTLNPQCTFNLALYLVKNKSDYNYDRPAIFLTPAGIRTINILSAENQINPENITIIGYEIKNNSVHLLEGEKLEDFQHQVEKLESEFLNRIQTEEDELQNLSPTDRFTYWREYFNRCIKCYACREACPMCYCTQCITDQNQPQWINPSAHILGNFEWNIVRAFHLAGRCSECGNCETVCPANIPLMKINTKVAKEIYQQFNYFPGKDKSQLPCLATFTETDPQEFIK